MANHLLQILNRYTDRAASAIPDADLLSRFSDTRDNDAFAELVRRHGPIVYRICRRLVGAAADDAFQATFLVLATRAAAAAASRSIGGWLVGVAGRVARQTRRSALRRTRYEAKAAPADREPTMGATPELRDQFRILDEELARLPDRLRGPAVSCWLQGRTQDQAAAEFGQTARTVRRRLDEARRLLRIRLERRGVAPVVAAGLVAGAGAASAAVPSELTAQTVAIVFDFLTGGAAAGCTPVVLAKGVAMTMFARKVATFLVVTLAVGLTGLGIVLADGPKPVPPIPAAKTNADASPRQPDPRPNRSPLRRYRPPIRSRNSAGNKTKPICVPHCTDRAGWAARRTSNLGARDGGSRSGRFL